MPLMAQDPLDHRESKVNEKEGNFSCSVGEKLSTSVGKGDISFALVGSHIQLTNPS